MIQIGAYSNPGYQRLIFNTYTSSGWSNVYAYLYNSDDDKLAKWPGVNITSNILSNKHYYIEMPTNQYKYVIFNNGSSSQQTVNLAIPPMSDALCSYQYTNKANSTKYNYRYMDFIYKS